MNGRFRRLLAAASLLIPLSLGACDIWLFPAPTEEELRNGLVVMYSGASSAPIEMTFFYLGLKGAELNRGIESVVWGTPWFQLDNATNLPRHREWAKGEAARLAAYMDQHLDCPVTLIGYSAGAGVALLVAEAMPPDKPLDRFILMSADVSPDYDLSKALDGAKRGGVNYYSPFDVEAVQLISTTLGTFDRVLTVPASTIGFNTSDPRLLQVPWSAEMSVLGNFGGHFDYLFNPPWIAEWVTPWVLPDEESPESNAAP